MEELRKWLDLHKIGYEIIDKEVVEIAGFGKLFLADLIHVQSIFRGTKDELQFNLMETPEVLIEEGIYYVAFPFGRNWYYYDLREAFRFNILKFIGKRQPLNYPVKFVNLGIHTPFELLNGSGDISQWVKKAKYLGQNAIGICDRNTMAATLILQKECVKAGIDHVFGYSFTMKHQDEKVDMKIYCQTQEGLQNLFRIQKEIMVDNPENVIDPDKLKHYTKGNVLVMGSLSSYWIKRNPVIMAELKMLSDAVYYQVDFSEYKADRIDAEVLEAIKYYFMNIYRNGHEAAVIEPVLICDNYYIDKDEARNKIILNKIASGAAHRQSEDQYFKDTDEHFNTMRPLFSSESWNVEELFERMCANTVKIARGATAKYELGKMYMPRYVMQEEEIEKYKNRRNMFHKLLFEGLEEKVPAEEHEKYKKRLREEIYIIESTNNVDYFLIQWDMINEARKRNIVTGIGRGSAGGSLVSYLLGIITIDPVKYDLIFSRFLVPERCGLNWVDEITVMEDDVVVLSGNKVVHVEFSGNEMTFDKDATFKIMRDDMAMIVYADELEKGDEILFDNRDLLWNINQHNE